MSSLGYWQWAIWHGKRDCLNSGPEERRDRTEVMAGTPDEHRRWYSENGTFEVATSRCPDCGGGKRPGEGSREQQMTNLKTAVLERVKSTAALVAAKATPAEAQAYKSMLVSVAERAASASKEGGFLGFGGVRVSDKEQAFIAEVRAAAGIA